jgi:flavin-dependent dehydrogenase
MESIRAQVCILGGGPAGAAAARRLALLGHSVVVVEKASFPGHAVGESLPSAVIPLLNVLGVRDAVEAAAFLRPRSTIVRWDGEDEIREVPSPYGFHVNRARFDDILLRAAREAGAQVMQPTRFIRHVSATLEGHTIDVRTADGSIMRIQSDFVIDAMGRGSSLSGRMNPIGHRTSALYAHWQGNSFAPHDTAIEACPSAWLWGGALADNLQHAAVFVETADLRAGIAKHGSADRFYESAIASSGILSRWITGTRVTRVHVCDATPFWCRKPVQNRIIKVGDASLRIDPLAAQGVQVAIGSALHAAAMLHTILERPSDESIAEQFYIQRQRRSMEFHAGAAASLYADSARTYPTPFWVTRARSVSERAEERRGVPVEWSEDTFVRLNPSVCFQEVPVIRGEFIVGAQGISVPRLRLPVVFLNNILIAPLLTALSGTMRCSEVVRAWSQSVPPKGGIQILNHLLQRDILQISSTHHA